MKKKSRETHGFIECLSRSRIPHTLALTGSAARGELRNNLGKYDYKSDTDILCIIAHNDIESALCCKQKYICPHR